MKSLAWILLIGIVTAIPARSQELLGSQDPVAASGLIGSQVQWSTNDPQILREGNRTQFKRLRKNRKELKNFNRLVELAKARKTARRKKRLVLWYLPRITGRQMYRPALPDLYMLATVFTDPECVALINRMFVPVRLICDKPLQKATGITPPDDVEPALVFMKPDGTIVRKVNRIRTFDSFWFLQLFRQVLRQYPAYAKASYQARKINANRGSHSATFQLGLEQALDGQWEAAQKSFKRAASKGKGRERALALCHLAAMQWRLLDSPSAARNLAQAEKLARAAPLKSRNPFQRKVRDPLLSLVQAVRGRMALFNDNLQDARQAFHAVSTGPRRPEAFFYLGMVDWFLQNEAFGRRDWVQALAQNPRDPYAWKAALNLVNGPDMTPLGPTTHGFEVPFRPRTPLAQSDDTSAPVSPQGETSLVREGLEVLLRLQRSSGGWTDARYAYWSSPDETPNVWISITALSMSALLDWRRADPERVSAALERGERYLFNEQHMARGYNEEIYAEGYKLAYLVRKYDAFHDPQTRQETLKRMNQGIQNLKRLQDQRGFFAHEYPNAFCTASVVSALAQARRRGARVPQAMLLLSGKGLASLRSKQGTFPYAARGFSAPKDSMGRNPICEAAILESGDKSGSQKKVAAALDNFWKYLPRLERIRKCDFHTDGELGGFFFWHDIYHTTEAIQALSPKAQRRHKQLMLDYIRKIGEFDGSFVDSHEFGKSYGTAMALLVLKKVLGSQP